MLFEALRRLTGLRPGGAAWPWAHAGERGSLLLRSAFISVNCLWEGWICAERFCGVRAGTAVSDAIPLAWSSENACGIFKSLDKG